MIFLMLAFGCYDVLEENIENAEVLLNSPPDGLETETLSITFWWEHVEGARNYEFQLVTSSFDTVYQLVSDTVTEDNKLQVQLFPGAFEWRVKAFNNGYQTEYSSRKFVVLNSDDLSKQFITLISPRDLMTQNDTTVAFSWEPIDIADEYTLFISGNDFELDTTTSGSDIRLSFEATDRIYTWQVRARNEISQTTSQTYTFTIDRTPPEAPELTGPVEGAVFQTMDDITFSWSWSEDNMKGDSIWVLDENSDVLEGFPLWSTDRTFIVNAGDLGIGQYSWELKSVDWAGNVSEISSRRSFEIE